MDWSHPEHADRRVRLGYCLNVHPARTLDEVLDGMRRITLPLRDRLAPRSAFGVGLYLSNAVARSLDGEGGARELDRLIDFLARERLVPFTYNAFPYERFHEPGLKADVFRPTWRESDRLEYTLAVARVASRIAREVGGVLPPAHVSISTHTGMFGAWVRGEEDHRECAENLSRAAAGLADVEAKDGVRCVLSIEPEPRANCETEDELALFLQRARVWGTEALVRERDLPRRAASDLLARHLGACLDTCHAAVEFEYGERYRQLDAVVGKLQFSSALALRDPASDHEAREALFALAEPVYLHQVTGFDGAERVRAADIAELVSAWNSGDARWRAAREWRCHFHVPVDLQRIDTPRAQTDAGRSVDPGNGERVPPGLTTTRHVADAILAAWLVDPRAWTLPDLHVEIETYTWDVLPRAARGAGDLVDGLEREYAHVMSELERAGWRRA